jgi:hypothetical protein
VKAAIMVHTLSRAVMYGFKSVASASSCAPQPLLLQLTPAHGQRVTFLQRQLQRFHRDLWLTVTTFELFARSFDLTVRARAADSRQTTATQGTRALAADASTSHFDGACAGTSAGAGGNDVPEQVLVDLGAYLLAVRVLLDKSGTSLTSAAGSVAATKDLQSWNQLFS